jgi:hypothetical protein
MYAILTLNLYKADTVAQNKFYRYLKKELWQTFSVKTTWHVDFKTYSSNEEIIKTTKLDLRRAASISGIKKYNSIFCISQNKPTQFDLKSVTENLLPNSKN